MNKKGNHNEKFAIHTRIKLGILAKKERLSFLIKEVWALEIMRKHLFTAFWMFFGDQMRSLTGIKPFFRLTIQSMLLH